MEAGPSLYREFKSSLSYVKPCLKNIKSNIWYSIDTRHRVYKHPDTPSVFLAIVTYQGGPSGRPRIRLQASKQQEKAQGDLYSGREVFLDSS